MSLINDALKRAAEAQKKNPSDSLPVESLQPVASAAQPNRVLRLLAVLALLGLVGVSFWAFSQWWFSSRQPQAAAGAANPAASTAHDVSQARKSVEPALSPESSPSHSNIRVSTNIVIRTNPAALGTAPPEAVAAPPEAAIATPEPSPLTVAPAAATNTTAGVTNAPPGFPALKLQSIIYRPSNPAAVINGDMLHEGDTIREARVVKIERNTVTVVWGDQTNVLSLPRL